MAVIDTSMDMPESCYKCFKRNICFLAQCNGWIDTERDDDCPLKSANEMEAEIWEYDKPLVINDKHYIRISDAAEIIHKYCDKETTDGR